MRAIYRIQSMPGNLAALVEITTGVRIHLGSRSDCIQFAERFELNYLSA